VRIDYGVSIGTVLAVKRENQSFVILNVPSRKKTVVRPLYEAAEGRARAIPFKVKRT
jgi:hypothetical protein